MEDLFSEFTIHFATINTHQVTAEEQLQSYLQYTLLLLIPHFYHSQILIFSLFTIHFATINTVTYFAQYL